MNEKEHERLSALVDGELTHEASSTIDNLCEDEQAEGIWARYCLIGDCLRGSLPERYENMTGEIRAAVASGPTVFVPDKRQNTLVKPIIGFAIAASVAAIAIFNVQQQARQVPAADQSGIAENETSISVPQPAHRRNHQLQSPDPRLSRYLVSYDEYRVNTGVRGMPPHVRMVAVNVVTTK